jgi:hypothetical protein
VRHENDVSGGERKLMSPQRKGFWQLRIVGKISRIEIRIPSELLCFYEREAEKMGCSRNLLVAESLEHVRCEKQGKAYVPYLVGLPVETGGNRDAG